MAVVDTDALEAKVKELQSGLVGLRTLKTAPDKVSDGEYLFEVQEAIDDYTEQLNALLVASDAIKQVDETGAMAHVPQIASQRVIDELKRLAQDVAQAAGDFELPGLLSDALEVTVA